MEHTRNREQRLFRKVWTRYTKNLTLMKLRLGFLVEDLSQHLGIYLLAFVIKFFIHGYK